MKINNVTNVNLYTARAPEGKKTLKNQEIKDEYIPSQPLEPDKKATYQKPSSAIDRAAMQRLIEESEKAYSQLRELVRQLLEKQGLSFKYIEGGEIEIDEETRIKAQQMIDEGGPLSPEKVSDRIVEFAKAISGGDKEKIEMLRSAIDKGFKEAAEALGGELPEISWETYELINKKLDAWLNE
ncbi:MAG TPA: hypothetical protein GXX14_10905 [Clostridiaceae bacterium]|nr:hypothetical protein [Clostridiaceae bacterium]